MRVRYVRSDGRIPLFLGNKKQYYDYKHINV